MYFDGISSYVFTAFQCVCFDMFRAKYFLGRIGRVPRMAHVVLNVLMSESCEAFYFRFPRQSIVDCCLSIGEELVSMRKVNRRLHGF